VIGHGLFGLSLMEGLKSELKLYEETSVASLGWDEVRFKGPIVAGDALRVRFRFVEKRPTKNPERGIVVETLDLLNQRDEVVTAARHISLILTRQAARGATAAT
jgi:acyl dehydratase